jgi:hypothetical protein
LRTIKTRAKDLGPTQARPCVRTQGRPYQNLGAPGDIQPLPKEIDMSARNAAVRVALFCAAVLSTSLTLGSVLALADLYSGTMPMAAAPSTVVAQR